jgi:hypothetical protein
MALILVAKEQAHLIVSLFLSMDDINIGIWDSMACVRKHKDCGRKAE